LAGDPRIAKNTRSQGTTRAGWRDGDTILGEKKPRLLYKGAFVLKICRLLGRFKARKERKETNNTTTTSIKIIRGKGGRKIKLFIASQPDENSDHAGPKKGFRRDHLKNLRTGSLQRAKQLG